jgi:L-2-hydroxyglutarate oxidase LhgO
MKKNTPEKWVEEFEEKFDDAVVFMNEKVLIFATEDEIKDFIRKTRQEVKQETIKEMKEWAMEYKYARHNPDIYCDCETCMFVKNLLSKLNSI